MRMNSGNLTKMNEIKSVLLTLMSHHCNRRVQNTVLTAAAAAAAPTLPSLLLWPRQSDGSGSTTTGTELPWLPTAGR